MKRLFAVLLTLVMAFSMCACGGGNESAENSENATTNDSLIEFEKVVLVDNETVKIELINFYAEDVNWSAGAQNEKCITFKATNKSDHEISISINAYLGDEALWCCARAGTMMPAPGKSGQYDYMIAYNTTPEHTALESLEQLYSLEGSFDILNIYENSMNNTEDSVSFNIQAAINGETISEEPPADSLPDSVYNVGDTVSTDIVEFTLTGFDYVHYLDPKTHEEKADNAGGALGPADTDMVFANPEFTIKNIAKTAVQIDGIVSFAVDYDNGYIFDMYDHMSYLVDTPGIARKISGQGSSSGISMDLSPLSSETYEMYFSANSLIETNTEASLLLTVSLATTSGTEEFVFRIR